MKILLVEDDAATGAALTEILTVHHYSVSLVTDGQTGLEMAQTELYDLILLDVGLPRLDGISLCRNLRTKGFAQPILLLTAKDSSTDQVMGLDAGADDYVTKPFDVEALLARIRALLRRGHSVASSMIQWENIQFDTAVGEVSCDGRSLHLTPKEYCLLELFLLNPKRIFSRRAILDRLWDFAEAPGEETVSTHIKCLRQKLRAGGASGDPVETVHGLGYRLRSPSQEPPLQELTPIPLTTKAATVTTRLWDKFKTQFTEQVTALVRTIAQIQAGQNSLDLRRQAKQEAHKLGGSLGIFGLIEGSQLAREIEHYLQTETELTASQLHYIRECATKLEKLLHQSIKQPEPPPPPIQQKTLILIIDDDLMLAERLRIEAIAWNFAVEIATDLTVARRMITQLRPQVILLDLSFPDSSEDGLALLAELSDRPVSIPTLVFTGRESLADRVAVARLGAAAFLHKPLSSQAILKAIVDTLNQQQYYTGNRVLVVDDDSAVLNMLSKLLQSCGLEVATLNHTSDFWEVLNKTLPNLVLLDLEIAEFSGIDLCQVIRNDPNWSHLPVLFFSAHTDEQAIARAFAAGADDYISKSLSPTEITQRIIRRIKPLQNCRTKVHCCN